MPPAVGYEKRQLTWDEVDGLANRLVERLRERQFDLFLGIARGGLPLTGILAKRLNHFPVLTISVMRYDAEDRPLQQPILLQSPNEFVLTQKRVLIIDDVWDEGMTIAMVKKIVLRASGIPEVAVLHYKPSRSKIDSAPEYFAEETDDWIVYPWELNAEAL